MHSPYCTCDLCMGDRFDRDVERGRDRALNREFARGAQEPQGVDAMGVRDIDLRETAGW